MEGRNRQTLAETGIDFITGAVAVLNVGHWLTWARGTLRSNAAARYHAQRTCGRSSIG